MKLGITGYPLTYTQSPKLHRAFLREVGKRGSYDVYPFAPARGKASFFRFLDSLRKQGLVGLNVTVPFKEWAYVYAMRRGGAVSGAHGRCARLVRAANTLIFRDKRVYAANTDSFGFWEDVESYGTFIKKRCEVLIVGTGGAAKGVVAGILARYPAARRVVSVRVWGRDHRKAAALARKVKPVRHDWRAQSTLVVWCLPPVSKTESRRIWNEIQKMIGETKEVHLYDLNYGARADCTKEFVAKARRRTGMGMLRRQARAAFDLWA